MPLCIICKTEEGDVKKGVEELRRRGKETITALTNQETPHLVQVGMRRYNNLKKASLANVVKAIEKKHITHLLNINTLTIHRRQAYLKKNCPYAGKNVLNSYIVNDTVTGLRRCKHCM